MILIITIPGAPVPKGRPRVTRNRAGQSVTYTPKPTRDYEKLVRDVAALHCKKIFFTGPVQVNIDFGLPIPKSWSKKRRREAVGEYHASRPDLDNLAKAVLDGMEGIVFADDRQIASLVLTKQYTDHPDVTVTATEIAL